MHAPHHTCPPATHAPAMHVPPTMHAPLPCIPPMNAPPVNRMTDACENITLPHFVAGGKNI